MRDLFTAYTHMMIDLRCCMRRVCLGTGVLGCLGGLGAWGLGGLQPARLGKPGFFFFFFSFSTGSADGIGRYVHIEMFRTLVS